MDLELNELTDRINKMKGSVKKLEREKENIVRQLAIVRDNIFTAEKQLHTHLFTKYHIGDNRYEITEEEAAEKAALENGNKPN